MDVLAFARQLRAELRDEVAKLDKFIALGEALLREDAYRRSERAPSVAAEPAPSPAPVAARQPEPIPMPDPSTNLPNVALSMYQGLMDEATFSHVLRAERERRHAQVKGPVNMSAKAPVREGPAPIGQPKKTAATG